jgi:hypothetical protein
MRSSKKKVRTVVASGDERSKERDLATRSGGKSRDDAAAVDATEGSVEPGHEDDGGEDVDEDVDMEEDSDGDDDDDDDDKEGD